MDKIKFIDKEMEPIKTKRLVISDVDKDRAALEEAAELLRSGGLVAIPTETVYGLAANALDPEAAGAIYHAKGRPSDNPLIVHVCDVEAIRPLVREIPDCLYRLAERFWPGPLTIILPKSALVPLQTTGGLDTVALRIPAHPVARELIRLAGTPLAAPSANRSGCPSPTSAAHCMQDMEGRIHAVVDSGNCTIGLESTVMTLCSQPPRILRPGAVTIEMLREILPDVVMDPAVFGETKPGERVLSPGMKYRHYSPEARVILVRGSLAQFLNYLSLQERVDGVICFDEDTGQMPYPYLTLGSQWDANSQAYKMFDVLRMVDREKWNIVYVRVPVLSGIGTAVYNRLLRAAGFTEVLL